SNYASSFVLKGAILFAVWSKRPHRTTRDVDLLGYGNPDLARLETVFREICITDVEDDGLRFDPTTVKAAPIREEAVYDGVRVTFLALLGTARIPVQVDVGFGDATDPPAVLIEMPTLLAYPTPKLRGYRREVVIAEKLHAMVDLGVSNSRMKDYYDVWYLAQHFEIDGPTLAIAFRSTFERRRTSIPIDTPTGLTSEFSGAPSKQAQWNAFVQRTRLAVDAPSLAEAANVIASLVVPVFHTLTRNGSFGDTWPAGGPWKRKRTNESA
ncbi:MAG TPA: nucleotidyl transferase AbiEii/AbiGii toxin family protein, partial [Polyangiaceae bacterium]|nr:nucleotidyl transferase AbiEii/AbiGii toxin family protein [Polyangiaceae bacterium]